MAIKIKHRDPRSTDFSPKDIVVNVKEGTLFYKSDTSIFRIQGDDLNTLNTEVTHDFLNLSGSIIITGSITPKNDIFNFLKDRFRYYLKEKDIRFDIIEASISNFSTNKLFSSFEKARCVNKIINNQIGIDITSSYKRASNILQSEMENKEIEITNSTDPGIFKSDYEKNLFKKITDIKKYYSDIDNNENFEESLSVLAGAKKEVFEFFDNVKVNEDNEDLRKNRLELINMLCKTFQNFMNFQLLKANNE